MPQSAIYRHPQAPKEALARERAARTGTQGIIGLDERYVQGHRGSGLPILLSIRDFWHGGQDCEVVDIHLPCNECAKVSLLICAVSRRGTALSPLSPRSK